MQLSPHFELDELTHTSTGIPNFPSEIEKAKLTDLCNSILEVIRAKWGPIRIDSGFRCPEVNAKVGGVATSQHVYGEAADIVPMTADIDKVFAWIVNESGLNYGQAIREHRPSSGADWIHISLPDNKHHCQALISHDGRTYEPYA